MLSCTQLLMSALLPGISVAFIFSFKTLQSLFNFAKWLRTGMEGELHFAVTLEVSSREANTFLLVVKEIGMAEAWFRKSSTRPWLIN